MRNLIYAVTCVVLICISVAAQSNVTDNQKCNSVCQSDSTLVSIVDSLYEVRPFEMSVDGDTIWLAEVPENRHGELTEEDFVEVAEELGVEVSAIKAVVEIEAGKNHKGIRDDGKPLINFDLSVFRKMAAKNKVSLVKAQSTYPEIFKGPNASKYGSRQAGQQARLDAARQVDDLSAIEGTFWGMFQIGGFNWKKCGTASPDEFVDLMSRSERDQLELFAKFITNTGLLKHLKNKNWRAFARGYNGPGYAARGYHTRLAKAYAKYKKQEKL